MRTDRIKQVVLLTALLLAGCEGGGTGAGGQASAPPAASPQVPGLGAVTLRPTPKSQDFYGSLPQAKVGDWLIVRDPQGVICGAVQIQRNGEYGFVHVYADDPRTPQDEGANPGDPLQFELNGQPLRVVQGKAIWQADGLRTRVDLSL